MLVERAAAIHGCNPLGRAAGGFVLALGQTHVVGAQDEGAAALEAFVIADAYAGDEEHGADGLRCCRFLGASMKCAFGHKELSRHLLFGFFFQKSCVCLCWFLYFYGEGQSVAQDSRCAQPLCKDTKVF